MSLTCLMSFLKLGPEDAITPPRGDKEAKACKGEGEEAPEAPASGEKICGEARDDKEEEEEGRDSGPSASLLAHKSRPLKSDSVSLKK